MIGKVLKERYRIYDKVGAGGFATVYLGRDLQTNAVVAVKVLKQEYTEDPKFVERFRREADMASRLQHPNVVRMLDYGIEDGVHFLVMEYIQGKTLAEIIQQRGPLAVEEALDIAGQTCRALEVADGVGVIHRDIKPHNIMVALTGEVKVMDFGIARMSSLSTLTQSGMFMGTPRYLSPEMAKGEGTDIRSDIYALGIVLYEMLVGATPFDAESHWAVLRHQIQSPPPPIRAVRPEVPESVENIVFKALAKDPDERFQTPDGMLAALAGGYVEPPTLAAAGAAPAFAGAALAPAPAAAGGRRAVWPIVIGAIVAMLVVAAIVIVALGGGARRAPATAEAELIVVTATASPSAAATVLQPTEPEPTDVVLLPTATATASDVPPSPTPIVVVVTPTAEPTLEPTTTPPASPTPLATATAEPSPTSPAAAATATPKAAPTAPPATPTSAPPPSTATGRIAFAVFEGDKYVLYSISAAGGDRRWLGDYLRQPSYRQDGVVVAANGEGGGMNDIWQVKADGGGRTESMGQPPDEHPIWLQDPKRYHIGFDSTRHGDGQWRLYLNNDTIMFGSGAIRGRFPVGLPGEEIAYVGCDYGFGTGANCGIFEVAQWGGTPLRLTSDPNDIPTGGGSPGVLFMRQQDGNWDVYLVAAGGGTPRRLTNHAANDGLATFSPDGRTIAFVSDRSGRWAIWLMGRDGSSQRKLADLPGTLGSNWASERLSWGPPVAGPAPLPTRVGGDLLPAPQITFPIPDDIVSAKADKATTVQWTWSRTLADNQGFEVRFWHKDDPAPMGVAAPTRDNQLSVHFGLTQSYLTHGLGLYNLEVVVVQVEPYKILSEGGRIQVKADPNK